MEQLPPIREAFSRFMTDGISKVSKTKSDLAAELKNCHAEVFKEELGLALRWKQNSTWERKPD